MSGRNIDFLSFTDKSCIEKLHLTFCKYVLGTSKTSSNLAVRTELGRYPLELQIKTQTLLYLSRLLNRKNNPLLDEAFLLTKHLDSEGVYCWYTYVKSIANEAGLDISDISNIGENQIPKLRKTLKSTFEKFYKDIYNKKIEAIDDNSKLFLYKSLKQSLNSEFYLKSKCFEFKNFITKFRISNHSLLIEKGRFSNIPRENRLCSKCNVVEDEMHFLLHCTRNIEIRKIYFEKNKTESCSIGFETLSDKEKINFMLNPSTLQQVTNTGSFLKQSLALRAGDL